MIVKQRLINFMSNRCSTLLGVGPMSKNCVDATIELANQYKTPLMLIASRRQIDSEEFGGGYVENWTTQEFSNYISSQDKQNNIILARDHGGPWQNEKESNLNLKEAMESAKRSYQADIDSGFQMLHIDPSIDIWSEPSVDDILDRVFELYEFCWEYAQKKGQDIVFEIGTEEQNGGNNTQEELEYSLNRVVQFCQQNSLPFPLFIVIQAGTRVMETYNVGSFDSPLRVANELPPEIQIPMMIEICNRYNICMKEHNTDYLGTKSLEWQPKLGIHAANVAPEFGVVETKAMIDLFESESMHDLADKFLQISYDSGKWKKWMLEDTRATDRDKAIIAGHYVFSSEGCQDLKDEARKRLKNNNLDDHLKNHVKESIFRYMEAFNLT